MSYLSPTVVTERLYLSVVCIFKVRFSREHYGVIIYYQMLGICYFNYYYYDFIRSSV